MNDKDLSIGIKATGTQEAAASINKVGDAVEDVGRKGNRAADGIKSAGKETEKLGKGGNAGQAALEFSRLFEDAQYGIRGVLNNIPVLIAALGGSAGLAGAISIAAVAGTQLWERMNGGTKSAKEQTEEYEKALEKVKETYRKIYAKEEEERNKQLKANADLTRERNKDIRDAAEAAKGREDVERARREADSQVADAREKFKLAELERKESEASGKAAVMYAEEQRKIVMDTIERKARERENERQAAEAAAERRVRDAKERLDQAFSENQKAAAEQNSVKAKIYELEEKKNNFAENRRIDAEIESDRLRAVEDEINRLSLQIKNGEGGDGFTRSLSRKKSSLEGEAVQIRESVNSKLEITQFEKDVATRIDELTKTIEPLVEKTDATNTALSDTSRAMVAATEALDNLRETQAIDRTKDRELTQFNKTETRQKNFDESQGITVEGINKLVDSIGDNGSKELQAAAQELRTFASDGKLTADELQKANTRLAQFANQIINLGQEQNKLLADALARVDQLSRDMTSLKTQASQAPKP